MTDWFRGIIKNGEILYFKIGCSLFVHASFLLRQVNDLLNENLKKIEMILEKAVGGFSKSDIQN
jgi:hypothetical protein